MNTTTTMSSIRRNHRTCFVTRKPALMISGYDMEDREDSCLSKHWDFEITGQSWGGIGYDAKVSYMELLGHGAGAGDMAMDRLAQKTSKFYGGRISENAIPTSEVKNLPKELLKEMVIAAVFQTVGMCYGTAGWKFEACEDGYGFERVYGAEIVKAVRDFAEKETERLLNK